MQGIYLIKNIKNNMVYIGSSIDLKHRFKMHKTDLINQKHHNKMLQEDWNLYGFNCFEFTILETTNEHCDLIEFERKWINKFIEQDNKKVYNMFLNATAKGFKVSERTKNKISNATILQLKNNGHPFLGKHQSDAVKKKLKELNTGKGNPNYGIKTSDATKEKISIKARGINNASSKLKECDVIEIRESYTSKINTVVELAQIYNVHLQTIYFILQRKTWKHI